MDNLLQKLMLGSSTAALMTALSLSSAQAQNEIEQVVVSASRITIAGYTQPTPVTVVGAAQLERNAFSNIADAVRELPQVNSPPSGSGINNGGAISGTEGQEQLNLRSLGITRTLILFDGQRMVSSVFTGGVDINTLPSGVIARVDVVTGGASAAWGSDAVSGVVNFVINKDFDGLKGNAGFSDTTDGKFRGWNATVVWGGDVFGDRGHLLFAVDYAAHPDVLFQGAKNWFRGAKFVNNPAYVPGNGQPNLIVANNVGLGNATQGGIIVSSPAVTAANSPSGVATAANALRGIQFTGMNGDPQKVDFGNLTNGVLSNGGSQTSLSAEDNYDVFAPVSTRYTAFAYGRYKLSATMVASLQLNYGYANAKGYTQPALQTALVIKSDNAFIPASVKLAMTTNGITSFTMGKILDNNLPHNVKPEDYFMTAEASLGPSTATNQRQMMRGVFTLAGTVGDNWSWTAFYQHGMSRLWNYAWGDPILANLALSEDAVTVTTANRGTSGIALGAIACRSTLTAPTNGCIPMNPFGNLNTSSEAINYIAPARAMHQNQQMNQD